MMVMTRSWATRLDADWVGRSLRYRSVSTLQLQLQQFNATIAYVGLKWHQILHQQHFKIGR
uniref:Uncharacterized protein n=1 Tax=Physcomitrium patens TaxID=3218 RepID=A0A2K1IRF5_PHYPA|nr:hypothetical protein PHYPA_025987 [Physcomitrium patens]